jgi:hypothetical protein
MSCQVLVPVAFFGLMCIPKHYIKPQPLPRQILSQAIDLDMGLASKPGSTDYKGAQQHSNNGCTSQYAPLHCAVPSRLSWAYTALLKAAHVHMLSRVIPIDELHPTLARLCTPSHCAC